jgi:hypothetical protein
MNYTISYGPDKKQLAQSLINSTGKAKVLVTFTVDDEKLHIKKQALQAVVYSMQAEDGSSESWNLELGIEGDSRGPRKAYYHSGKRSGAIHD